MKHRTIPPRVRPVESLRRQFVQADGLPFADVLSAHQLQQVLSDCPVEFRERIFSPLITVATFLSQMLDPDHSTVRHVQSIAWVLHRVDCDR